MCNELDCMRPWQGRKLICSLFESQTLIQTVCGRKKRLCSAPSLAAAAPCGSVQAQNGTWSETGDAWRAADGSPVPLLQSAKPITYLDGHCPVQKVGT